MMRQRNLPDQAPCEPMSSPYARITISGGAWEHSFLCTTGQEAYAAGSLHLLRFPAASLPHGCA